MATHSSILAWKIPWTEKPGGLQDMGSQRVMTERPSTYQTVLGLRWKNEMVNDGVALRICRGPRHINLQVVNSQRCTCACTLLSHKVGHVHAPSMSGCAFGYYTGLHRGQP